MPSRQEQIERAMRNAQAAGDTVAVEILGRALAEGQTPAPDTARAAELDQTRANVQERRRQAGATPTGPRFPGLPVGDPSADPSLDQLRETARMRRQPAEAAGITTDDRGQRFDEGGVPIGGVPMPRPRFPGTPVGDDLKLDQKRAVATASARLRLQQQNEADPKFGGMAMNATAGANEALYGVAGMPVDLMRGGINLASRGINAVAGSDIPQIAEDSFGGSRSIANAMGAVRPELDPANTEAASFEERLARGVGQGVAGAVAPAGAVGGLARAGVIGPQAARTAQAVVGRAGSRTDAALGAVSGAGAAIGQEAAPDGYEGAAGMAGGMLAGGIGATALAGGRAAVAPFTSGGRARLAGERLAGAAKGPMPLRDLLIGQPEPEVAGSQPTTFQRTGDLGVGALEKDQANRFPEAFAQRRADQNQARVAALRGVEPAGAPEKVATALRQRLDEIDAETDRLMDEAAVQARGSASAVGTPSSPQAAGGTIRQSIETSRAQVKAREGELWGLVDPDGTLVVPFANTRESVQGITREMTPFAQPLSDTERQIYGAIQGAGDVASLRAMRDLQSNLKTAMRAERSAAGETPAYRRMSIVSAGIARDFDSAVATKAAQEAEAVASGAMRLEDTLLGRYEQQREGWLAGRSEQTGVASAGAGTGAYGGTRPTSVPGPSGAAGEARGGLADGAGNPGLAGGQPTAPNFDAAAQERLNAANTATRERAQTFDNRTLTPIRARPATNAPFTMPAGEVPGRIFNTTPKSPEAIGRLRAAIGDEAATEALQGYAVGEVLRVAGRPDGTIDPARLATWRRSHAGALRELPALDARLADAGRASEAMAEVAAARADVRKAAQAGALGRLVGVDDPSDVTRMVGGVFSAQDAAQRMRAIRHAVGSDPEALQGLRRAVVDHIAERFVGNVEVGTSGTGGMRSSNFQDFVRRNGAALREAGFGKRELATLDAIAADLQRSGRSVSSVKNPGGSDTAQNLLARLRGDSPFAVMARVLAAPGAAGISVGVANGSTAGLAAGATAGVFVAMRNAGLRTVDDLVTDALLNPERARILLSTVPAGSEASVVDALARSYGRTAAQMLGAEEKAQPAMRKADVPDYMRQSMAAGRPIGGRTAAVQTMASTGRASPPWMDPEFNAPPLQRALAEREAKR